MIQLFRKDEEVLHVFNLSALYMLQHLKFIMEDSIFALLLLYFRFRAKNRSGRGQSTGAG